MQTLIDDGKLKQLLKEAVMEAFEEKRPYSSKYSSPV